MRLPTRGCERGSNRIVGDIWQGLIKAPKRRYFDSFFQSGQILYSSSAVREQLR